MNRYWDELARFKRDGFDVVIDKTWEDVALRDCFDDTCYDIADMERKVNSGFYDWFMLRVRVMLKGHELGSAYMGGCLYEDAQEVIKDGTAEDLIWEAMKQAIEAGLDLKDELIELCLDERIEEYA